MPNLSLTRLWSAGLLAGFVIGCTDFLLHGWFLRQAWIDAMAEIGRPAFTPEAYLAFGFSSLLVGLSGSWVYAALASRNVFFAAVAAALVVWSLTYMAPGICLAALDMFPPRLLAIRSGAGLLETMLGCQLAAYVLSSPGPVRRQAATRLAPDPDDQPENQKDPI